MKLSQIIEQVESLIEIHGDVEVASPNYFQSMVTILESNTLVLDISQDKVNLIRVQT